MAEELADRQAFRADPIAALDIAKKLLLQAAKVLLHDDDIGSTEPRRLLHWCSTAMRGLATGQPRLMSLALRKAPKLASRFSFQNGVLVAHQTELEATYLELLRVVNAQDIAVEEATAANSDLPLHKREKARQRCAQLWRARREYAPAARYLVLAGVTRSDGVDCASADEAIECVRGERAPTFTHRNSDLAVSRVILDNPVTLAVEDLFSYPVFCGFIDHASICVVGPDGTGGHVWRVASEQLGVFYMRSMLLYSNVNVKCIISITALWRFFLRALRTVMPLPSKGTLRNLDRLAIQTPTIKSAREPLLPQLQMPPKMLYTTPKDSLFEGAIW